MSSVDSIVSDLIISNKNDHHFGFGAEKGIQETYQNDTTVHQRIADPRLNFELFCDWLKTGLVV